MYLLLDIHWFWSTLILLFVFIPLTLLWVFALIDLFVNPGVSIVAKVIWLIVIIIFPLIGALIYLLVRPSREAAVFVSTTTPAGPGAADQLARADELRRSGAISEEEYNRLKAKLLG